MNFTGKYEQWQNAMKLTKTIYRRFLDSDIDNYYKITDTEIEFTRELPTNIKQNLIALHYSIFIADE